MKKVLLITLLVILVTPIATAITIDIAMPYSFSQGQTVYFKYTIFSETTQQIIFIPHVICPNAPIAAINQKIINLAANFAYNDTYKDIYVDNSIEPQTCTAYVRLLSPVKQTISKNFTIATNPSFSFGLKICRDKSCIENPKIFVKDQNAYIDYSSEVSDPLIIATMTYPNNTKRQLTLPSSIKAEQIGTYTLEAIASKQGYKTMNIKEQFGVIEKEAEIKLATICNANGKCEGKENKQNCPQDCLETKKSTKHLLIISLVMVFILIIGILLYYRFSKKNAIN